MPSRTAAPTGRPTNRSRWPKGKRWDPTPIIALSGRGVTHQGIADRLTRGGYDISRASISAYLSGATTPPFAFAVTLRDELGIRGCIRRKASR